MSFSRLRGGPGLRGANPRFIGGPNSSPHSPSTSRPVGPFACPVSPALPGKPTGWLRLSTASILSYTPRPFRLVSHLNPYHRPTVAYHRSSQTTCGFRRRRHVRSESPPHQKDPERLEPSKTPADSTIGNPLRPPSPDRTAGTRPGHAFVGRLRPNRGPLHHRMVNSS